MATRTVMETPGCGHMLHGVVQTLAWQARAGLPRIPVCLSAGSETLFASGRIKRSMQQLGKARRPGFEAQRLARPPVELGGDPVELPLRSSREIHALLEEPPQR